MRLLHSHYDKINTICLFELVELVGMPECIFEFGVIKIEMYLENGQNTFTSFNFLFYLLFFSFIV